MFGSKDSDSTRDRRSTDWVGPVLEPVAFVLVGLTVFLMVLLAFAWLGEDAPASTRLPQPLPVVQPIAPPPLPKALAPTPTAVPVAPAAAIPTVESAPPPRPREKAPPAVTPPPASRVREVPVGEVQSYAASLLGDSQQFTCLAHIVQRESHWNPHAGNPDGSYGVPQALPGDKMASEGADWHDNPKTQVRWMVKYLHSRYGTACGAWTFWQSHGWY